MSPHGWHAALLAKLYVPAVQLVQEVAPATDIVPGAQLAQLSDDEFDQAVLYLPAPHGWRGG